MTNSLLANFIRLASLLFRLYYDIGIQKLLHFFKTEI